MNFTTEIKELKGIGDKSGALFHKLNIDTVKDLLEYYPRTYKSFEPPVSLRESYVNMDNAVYGTVITNPNLITARNLKILSFMAKDSEGEVFQVRIFNMPYLKNSIKSGYSAIFYGKIVIDKDHYRMDQPKFYKPSEYEAVCKGIYPNYPTTKGLSSDSIKKYIKVCFDEIGHRIPEHFPEEMLKEKDFPTLSDCARMLHFPADYDEVYLAKKRLSYDEFFFFCLNMKLQEENIKTRTAVNVFEKKDDVQCFIDKLPFELTKAQLSTWKDIEGDLCSGIICNRLIQGDVGCGKTMVAVLALLSCVLNDKQGAMMAPTEVLATQHYQTVLELIEEYKLPFKPCLLTGSVKVKDKKVIYEGLKNGTYNLCIGTHALLEELVVFQNLSLVVTDEQHRFGVKQRLILSNKGEDVHTIVMSATPIPRSLAMILYGGLDVSTIKELPSNRIPIKNAVVDTKFRVSAYKKMQDEIDQGRQVYIICPMVEAGVMEELENVQEYSKKIKPYFKESVRIAVLHGKMKGKEKNEIMEAFSNHEFDILVSTTVIEVGINVPNATVMMIENAERFGLAALHQLRGRVGRGSHQSYCIFMNSSNDKKAKNRLDILGQTNDGFEIANADLKLRGPGEMTGTLQSGDSGFVYADVYEDADMLYLANEDVTRIIKNDPSMSDEQYASLYEKYKMVLNHSYINII